MRNKWVSWVLIFCVSTSSFLMAEAVDDKYTHISPSQQLGAGEFVHGQSHGKILMRVLMFGAISTQGVHYVPEGTDLLFAMVYAGGYTENTKLNGITIRRRGVKDPIEVDLQSIMEDGDTVPKLADGDVITIPYNWRRDIATVTLVTGFITSMTGFALSLISLTR